MELFKKKTAALPEAVISRQEISVIHADVEQGLSPAQAEDRRACGWANKTSGSGLRTEKQIILDNCITFFNMVFMVLAFFLVIVGSIKELSFLIIVVINTVIGCVQEIRAKRAVEKLTLVAAQNVKTVRGGRIIPIRSDLLVRDDIVLLSAGDQICADAVVRKGELQVNESLITGEQDLILKRPGDELKSGSYIVAGHCHAQLTKVGDDAFAAKLSKEAKQNTHATESEMMRSLDGLIRVVGWLLIPMGIILFCQEFFTLELGFKTSVEGTVGALVGMIPEGLYLLTSIAMAASAMKLTKQRILVQDTNCIETLARVDMFCVDKTGTITEPVMEVENVLPLSTEPHEYMESVLTALYGSTEPDNDTGRALHEMFKGACPWRCVRRIPFTSAAKWSGAVFEEGAFLAGAPEFILGERYAELEPKISPWSSTGYRVLLIARYHGDPVPGKLDVWDVEPMALVLLTNRIRPEAPDTFRYFAQQGVTIKVISGDNPATVSDVARRAGIENAEDYIDASKLETDEEFLDAVDRYAVFGRVTPDKKKRLVLAMKQKGHTVAMTGDGVNDVLAMKEAHCGIAMASGSQAASQVAQLVLLDSNFAAVPSIVGEGRRVINNIQRAATLFLAKNIFSLFLSVISFFTNWPYPIQPLHLSVISALTIGVPSFFLAMEPNYERVRGNFLVGVLRRAFPGGITNIFVVLAAQAFMAVFGMTLEQTSTVCAAILGVVGLLVLYQVCRPMGKFRRLIWWLMAAALAVCFTCFSDLFELTTQDNATVLVMVTLLIMTPTVFTAVQRVFDWGDKALEWLAEKYLKLKAE